MEYKIDSKRIRKLFIVRVSARRYEGWRHSPHYKKLGGLYGLMIGARFKREITAKVFFKDIMPDELYNEVIDRLEERGYEIEPMRRLKPEYHLCYAVYTTIEEFRGNTDKEITAKAKQFCKELKESIANEVVEVIHEVLEHFIEQEDIYEDVIDELKKLRIIKS